MGSDTKVDNSKIPYIAEGAAVLCDGEVVARCDCVLTAKRIARALNAEKDGWKGLE
jgi:hypothetical protein